MTYRFDMSRNEYLTKKLQPGEIQSNMEFAKIMHDADIIVAAGLRSGLLRYPPGTVMTKDGSPIPITPTTTEGKRRSIDSYPCLKAYLLRQQGKTMLQISQAIHCSTRIIQDVLQHGETIYKQKTAAALGGSQTCPKHR